MDYSFIHSFRFRLTVAFFIFIFVMVLVAVQVYIIDRKIQTQNSILNDAKKLKTLHLEIFKAEKDFFENELINPVFYAKDSSQYLLAHAKLLSQTRKYLDTIAVYERFNEFDLHNDIQQLQTFLTEYEAVFYRTIQLIKQRGFLNYGLEGAMRRNIHVVENEFPAIKKEHILMLRRHEKDYLLRKDTLYKTKLETQLNEIYRFLSPNHAAMPFLKSYWLAFKELVELERRIGIDNQDGLRRDINYTHQYISYKIDKLEAHASVHTAKASSRLFIILGSSIALTVLFSLLGGYFLAREITYPIKDLAENMNQAVYTRFEANYHITAKTQITEYKMLQKSFSYMLSELKNYIAEVKEKNLLLEEQNHELIRINEELNTANQKLQYSEDNLKKLNSVKDKFLSIISHDVKAPLNTLKGLLSVITLAPDALNIAERNEMFGKIQSQVDALIRVLNSMLEWARAQTGEIRYQPQVLNVALAVKETVQLLSETAKAKNIAIETDVDETLSAIADKNMLDLILRNLISNAIKFTPHGGKVRISAHTTKGFVYVEVSDTGVGMDAEHLENVLNPLVHITTEGTNKEKGTGFGLLFCKEFVERNGGKMLVTSTLNVGTSVQFTLPVS